MEGGWRETVDDTLALVKSYLGISAADPDGQTQQQEEQQEEQQAGQREEEQAEQAEQRAEKSTNASGGGFTPATPKTDSVTVVFPLTDYVKHSMQHSLAWTEIEGGFPTCLATVAGNETWLALHQSMDRCISPFHRLHEIYPDQLVWSSAPTPGPAEEEQRDESGPNQAKERAQTDGGEAREGAEGSSAAGGGGEGHGGGTRAIKGASNAAKPEPEAGKEPAEWVVFFLYTPREHFSSVMDAAVHSVAGAFPHVWFIKGQGAAFSRFTAQYHVRSFPRLLLFNNGKPVGKFKGKCSVPALALWLTRQTGVLPVAEVLPFQPSPVGFHMRSSLVWALVWVAYRGVQWAMKRNWRGRRT